MKISKTLIWLSILAGLLGLVAAGAGLFYQDGGQPYTFTSLHGQSVQIYGQGIYRSDTLFTAAGFRGADAVTLFVALPLLAFAIWQYARGSRRSALLLVSSLSYFLYNAVTMCFATAYNNLVFISLFSKYFRTGVGL